MARKKILIVDDEERILRSTKMLLEVLGFDAVTVKDPREILAVAARERPDLIFQDLKMPALDLPSLIEALKADPATAGIPFVFFSASSDVRERAAELDAHGFLAKPFQEAELLEVISRSLPKAAPEGYA